MAPCITWSLGGRKGYHAGLLRFFPFTSLGFRFFELYIFSRYRASKGVRWGEEDEALLGSHSFPNIKDCEGYVQVCYSNLQTPQVE